jgi:hypothetical protein
MHPMPDYFFGRIFIRMAIQYATYMHFYVGKISFLQKVGATDKYPLLMEFRTPHSTCSSPLIKVPV